MTSRRKTIDFESPAMLRIRAVFEASTTALDAYQVAAMACVAVATFQNDYRYRLEAAGMIHVAEYRRNHHGPHVPAFRSGSRPEGTREPVKPPTISAAERSQRWKCATGYNEARKAERRLARPPDFALAVLLRLPVGRKRQTTAAEAAQPRSKYT